MTRIRTVLALLLVAMGMSGVHVAVAQVPEQENQEDRTTRTDRDTVRIGQDYALAPGNSADDVIVISGNSAIAGDVTGDVVVILGSTQLSSTATVGGDLVVVAGGATIEPGAAVKGDLVVIGGGVDAPSEFRPGGQQVAIGSRALGGRLAALVPWLTRGLLWGRPIVPDVPWVWWIVAFFFLVYLGVNLLFNRPVRASVDVLQEKPLTAFGVGLLVVLLVGPTFLILAVTVIGLTVIPVVICALLGGGIIGKVAVARQLGIAVVREASDERLLAIRSFAIGFALLCVAYVIPVLGFVAWSISGVLGIGAVTLAFVSAYRRENPQAPRAFAVAASRERLSPAEAGLPVGAPADVAPPSPVAVAAFPHATFRDRFVAFVLDVILTAFVVQMLEPRHAGRAFLVGLLAYHVGFWTWKQTTLGGIICQLRVVRVDGGRLTFADALVRGLSSIFSFVVAGLGALWILRDPERQAWHDKIAGTYVVKVPRHYPL